MNGIVSYQSITAAAMSVPEPTTAATTALIFAISLVKWYGRRNEVSTMIGDCGALIT